MDGHFNHTFLTKGSQVEVASDEDGFTGAWYVATVIHPPPSTASTPTRNNLVYVEYHNLLSEDGSSTRLREYANISFIRPSPVPDANPNSFQLNDVVDAFYRDGWWTGVVSDVVDASNYVVTFQNPHDEIRFGCSSLRIHKKWDGERWILPQKKQGIAEWMFTVGKKVEVSFEGESFRDGWFPATVLETSGNDTFVVEYQQAGVGDEAIFDKVTVDYFHIRPSPPHLRDKNFVLLEKVDGYYDFGWWGGVITKELADNRYIVFFKHLKKEREFSNSRVRPHMEWKGGKWFNTSQGETVVKTTPFLIDNQIEQAAPTDNQSPVATSEMKKRVKKILDTDEKSSSKDETMNEASEINQPPSTGKSEGEVTGITKNVSTGKKRGKLGNSSTRKTPTTDSSRKRGKLSNELKSLQASAVGFILDSVKTTKESVGKEDATKASPFVAESETKQPSVTSSPLTVPAQEGNEGDAASIGPKRKRGRPRKLQVGSPKTPVPVIHENTSVPSAPSEPKVPLTNDCLPNENSGQNLSSQRSWGTKKGSAKKAKKGKRRMININRESTAQESQDAPKEKTDASLVKDSSTKNPEASAGKSIDTTSDDQPLSRWFGGKHSPTIIHGPEGMEMNSGNVPFSRTTPLWKTIESLEAFQILPQEPHFRPLLQGVREGAREGLAIGTMVTFSSVYEKTRGLTLDDPRSTIEACLETLETLESNGFNVVALRKRLSRLLEIKEKQEKLKEETKQFAEKMEEHYVDGRKIKEEMEEVDRQMRELEERRKEALLKKEKGVSEIREMEAEIGRIEEERKEVDAEFDKVAAAPLGEPLVNGL